MYRQITLQIQATSDSIEIIKLFSNIKKLSNDKTY